MMIRRKKYGDIYDLSQNKVSDPIEVVIESKDNQKISSGGTM